MLVASNKCNLNICCLTNSTKNIVSEFGTPQLLCSLTFLQKKENIQKNKQWKHKLVTGNICRFVLYFQKLWIYPRIMKIYYSTSEIRLRECQTNST